MNKLVLQRSVEIKPVFRLIRRTWIDRLYQLAYADRVCLGRPGKLMAALWRTGFKHAQKLGVPNIGLAEVSFPERSASFRYNAANTQFHSLYMPIYHMGYEPETAALFQLLLRKSNCFFDIGSNWGYFSVFAAASGFKGRVRAFELQPGVFEDLQMVVTDLGLDDMIKCENAGLSDRPGRTGVQVPDGLHSGIGHMADGDEVEMKTLDDFIGDRPDLLKIDVEGAEAKVLKGGGKVLSECRPWVIFESWCNPGDMKAALEPLIELSGHNYVFFQPVLMKDSGPFAVYHTYGQYWDLEEEMILRLVPFTIEQRPLMQRHFNVLACPAERICELEELFRLACLSGMGVESPWQPRMDTDKHG